MSISDSRVSVIIVAGGSGTRMGGVVPKQFLEVAGKPILMYTVEKFHDFDPCIEIIIVLPEAHQRLWKELCGKHKFNVSHKVVSGGSERFFSVKNGIEAVSPDTRLIAVHDGVRPFVSNETIGNCMSAAEQYGAAIPVVSLVDSIRRILSDGNSCSVPRSGYVAVQTPQCFRADVLRRAYNQPFSSCFTDDASVVETLQHGIHLVPGNAENIKITTPVDMAVAEYLLSSATVPDISEAVYESGVQP